MSNRLFIFTLKAPGTHLMSKLTRCGGAQGIRIASVSRATTADRVVVVDPTICVLSTGSRARVDALLSDTRQVTGTVGVDGALRPAVGWSTQVFRQAGTGRSSVELTTLRVRSARVREACAFWSLS